MARPLTKHSKKGKRYSRRAAVDAEIDVAVTLGLAELSRRAKLPPSSGDRLSSECLLHLIRAARREGNETTTNTLLEFLLGRCENSFRRTIGSIGRWTAEDLRYEAYGRFTEMIARDWHDPSADELDFFECNFNAALQALRVDLIRGARVDARHYRMSTVRTDQGASEDGPGSTPTALRTAPEQEATVFYGELRKAIDRLPDKERRAVVLCKILGYPVESADPSKDTAAKRCGVPGRTIRNRLSSAERKLSQFKEDA